jgi:hypothetical protein
MMITPLKKIADRKYSAIAIELDRRSHLTNRIYQKTLMESACADFNKKIQNQGVLGEMGYSPSTAVNLSKVSHKIDSVNCDEKHIEVFIHSAKNPNGTSGNAIIRIVDRNDWR